MSRTQLTFLPWLRRGMGARAGEALEPGTDRRAASIEVAFEQGQAVASLHLAGPGDVIGVDPRVVSRTWPASGARDAEPNLFPLVEFDQPDLPWRHSPRSPGTDERLMPWIALLVASEAEVLGGAPSVGAQHVASVTLAGTALPLWEQLWAWAHVQILQDEASPEAPVDLAREQPERVVARLLAPRRLLPDMRYHAFLVPTYARGRATGLGHTAEDGAPGALAPAWTPDADVIELPYYATWSFMTGASGDFEALVRRLDPRPTPPTVGIISVDGGAPGLGLPEVADGAFEIVGALASPAATPAPWPDDRGRTFASALSARLNRPAQAAEEGGERELAPPLYGGRYAGTNRHVAGSEPRWFQDLNGDPRFRVAAALGAKLVRREQESWMESAYAQVGAIDRANEALRVAQMAREIAVRVQERHMARAQDLFDLAAPLQMSLDAGDGSVAASLRRGGVPDGLGGGAWRRVARPLGPIGRRQRRRATSLFETVSRLATGDLEARAPASRSELVTMHAMRSALGGHGRPALELSRVATSPAPRNFALGAGARRTVAVPGSSGSVGSVRARPAGRVRGARRIATPRGRIGGVARRPGATDEARTFRRAVTEMTALTASWTVPSPPRPRPPDVARLAVLGSQQLDPTRSFASVRRRIRVGELALPPPGDELEPVLAGPTFATPLYGKLVDAAQEWLLPGAEGIAVDTVTLLESNARFVEALLIGANHEMARELLWREFPTHPRKTFFRNFWDRRSALLPPGASPIADIPPIHTWASGSGLGEHGDVPDGLVLLLRGEFVRRYPNVLVYAQRAEWDEEEGRRPADEESYPVFAGRATPDVAFFGFTLTVDDVRGAPDASGDPGWYFVLQELVAEPRFGLDEGEADGSRPTSWNDLHWGHLGDSAVRNGHIDLDADAPDTRVVADGGLIWHADRGLGQTGARASHLALITLQRPVRVAYHAADLLGDL